MNKKLILAAVAVLALLVAVILLCSRCSDEPTAPSEPIAGTTQSTTTDAAESTSAPSETPSSESTQTTVNTPSETTVATTLPTDSIQATVGGDIGLEDSPFGTEATQPTDTTVPADTTSPSQAIDPEESTAPTQTPSDSLTYEAFINMTADEQLAYIESFESDDAFFDWYNAAKSAYDNANSGTELDGGTIDLGDIIGGNG